MKSLEFLDRIKKEFGWENNDLHDDKVTEEGQPKLVHPDILAKIPGVELENDYENVMWQALEGGIVQTKYFAESAVDMRKNINLAPDNHAEYNHRTG